MNSKTKGNKAASGKLTNLQPIEMTGFQRAAPAWVVWLSLLLVLLASLLPWRLWQPVPDPLMLLLAYWSLHCAARVGLLSAFAFGLLIDAQDTSVLGLHALCYVLAVYGVLRLRQRLLRFPALMQLFYIVPVFVLASLLPSLLSAWLGGHWPGWDWLAAALMSAALWPLLDFLVSLPSRHHDGDEVGPA